MYKLPNILKRKT